MKETCEQGSLLILHKQVMKVQKVSKQKLVSTTRSYLSRIYPIPGQKDIIKDFCFAANLSQRSGTLSKNDN